MPGRWLTDVYTELAAMGVKPLAVTMIRSKEGIHVYRVEADGGPMILKVFDSLGDAREISNYQLLSSLGIPTLRVIGSTQVAILLPDVESNEVFRMGSESDLSDPSVVRALARWYKVLHRRGSEFLATHDVNLYDETDVFTLANLEVIATATGTQDNPLWKELRTRFNSLRQSIDTLEKTLTHNDFYWTNLIVATDGQSAMMLDFNLLGKGYAYSDVRNVTSSLSIEARQDFLDEYGETNPTEVQIDAIVAPLIGLYTACRCASLPTWAQPALADLRSGTLLNHLKELGQNGTVPLSHSW